MPAHIGSSSHLRQAHSISEAVPAYALPQCLLALKRLDSGLESLPLTWSARWVQRLTARVIGPPPETAQLGLGNGGSAPRFQTWQRSSCSPTTGLAGSLNFSKVATLCTTDIAKTTANGRLPPYSSAASANCASYCARVSSYRLPVSTSFFMRGVRWL
jgi:hypothetical protein